MTPRSCDRCYSRKTRCDRKPICTSCLKSGAHCHYTEKIHYRRQQQVRLDGLQQQIQALQRENEKLKGSYSATPGDGPSPEVSQAPKVKHSATPVDAGKDAETVPATSHTGSSLAPTPVSNSRYLATRDGVDFVDLVEAVVDSSAPRGNMFARVSDAYCKPGEIPTFTARTTAIPDRNVAMASVQSYFDHWHLTFPLLYRPAFLQIVDRIYEEPGFYSSNADAAFAFDIVLALGSANSKRFEWSFKDTESHFARALSKLNSMVELRDIRSLQALLLCCQYEVHSSMRDTSDELWELLGKAARICLEIGLHQHSSSRMPKCELHLTGPIPASIQSEMQRRCFWCFYSLDRIVSVNLGRPLTLSDDDVDAELPSPLDDSQLEGGTMAGSSPPPSLSPFLQMIRLRRITSRIHRQLYTSVQARSLSWPEKRSLRSSLLLELDEWLNNIPQLGLPSTTSGNTSLSCAKFPAWYETLHWSIRLLVWRPSPVFPHQSNQATEDSEDVLAMIWHSSRFVISGYYEILQARRLNYSWICLYQIFMAGLSNIYSVGRSAQRRKTNPQAFLPQPHDVMNDIRDCSSVLTAICERWDDARSSCEIFKRLSSSAFRELLKTISSQHAETETTTIQPMASVTTEQPRSSTPAANGYQDLGQQNTNPATTPNGYLLDENYDFEHFFQDMQSSLQNSDYTGANEVLTSLGREWFDPSTW